MEEIEFVFCDFSKNKRVREGMEVSTSFSVKHGIGRGKVVRENENHVFGNFHENREHPKNMEPRAHGTMIVVYEEWPKIFYGDPFRELLSRFGWVRVPEPARSLFPWSQVPGSRSQVSGLKSQV